MNFPDCRALWACPEILLPGEAVRIGTVVPRVNLLVTISHDNLTRR